MKRIVLSMKSLQILAASGFVLLLISPFGGRAATPGGSNNPYLVLYLKRWEIAKLEVERQKIMLANETRNLERLRPLSARGVIPRERFEAQALRVQVAQLGVSDLQAKADEKKALLDVTKLRLENGLDIPVCPEEE